MQLREASKAVIKGVDKPLCGGRPVVGLLLAINIP